MAVSPDRKEPIGQRHNTRENENVGPGPTAMLTVAAGQVKQNRNSSAEAEPKQAGQQEDG
jgi:hypothetical protein